MNLTNVCGHCKYPLQYLHVVFVSINHSSPVELCSLYLHYRPSSHRTVSTSSSSALSEHIISWNNSLHLTLTFLFLFFSFELSITLTLFPQEGLLIRLTYLQICHFCLYATTSLYHVAQAFDCFSVDLHRMWTRKCLIYLHHITRRTSGLNYFKRHY